MQHEEPPATKQRRREFSIVHVKPGSTVKACTRCGAEHIDCPHCVAAKLIPNAYAFSFSDEICIHRGACYRHGPIMNLCPHTPDLNGLVTTDKISRERLIAIVSAFTAAALTVGTIAGILLVPLMQRIWQH